jgi:O-Antigen ligase
MMGSLWGAVRALGERIHLFLPGMATAYLASQSGGYFPGAIGFGALVLALLVVLRITLAREPFAGWGRAAAAIGLAGALLASWTLLSAVWSDAPGRAMLEFDRTLLLVLGFALLASFVRRPGDLSVALRWVLAAIVATAVAGLVTRLFPETFSVVAGRQPSRLAHPLTYWNAMSVFCALGAVLALHAASGEREPAAVRIGAGAVLPVLALAGYFPFSRGGIATALVGVGLYALLARPRRLLFTLLTAGPAVAVALVAAYKAEALATDAYAAPPGPEQGRELAVVLALAVLGAALARLALLRLERRADTATVPPGVRRAAPLAAGTAVVALAVAAVALDAPSRVADQYRSFVSGNVVQESADTRQRLTASGNNGRVDIWRVAADAFTASPLHGAGAGTYQLEWERERPTLIRRVDAHSLYLETLAELGAVGLLLLLVVIGGILAGFGRLLGGPDRHAAAAALAAGVALLLHAGLDWDWEMPALFAWLFMAGGLACARTPEAPRRTSPRRLARVAAGLACLLLALTPALVMTSQARLDASASAFARGDCTTALDAALDSTEALPARAEPFELIGYCDLRAGEPALAVAAFEAARRRDPEAWQYAYGLAVARALAGQDPRPAIAAARRLNPREPRAHDLAAALSRGGPAARRRAARQAPLPF